MKTNVKRKSYHLLWQPAINSCLDRTSESIDEGALKPNRNTKKFCVKRPNQPQKHSTSIELPFEGPSRRGNGGRACHKHKESMVRVIKSPYHSNPQLLDVNRSKLHPLVRNLFHAKVRQAPLTGRLKFYSENWEKLTQDVNILPIL